MDAPSRTSPISDASDLPLEFDPDNATLNDLKTTLQFINLLRNATLDDGTLDDEIIDRLRNPLQGPPEIDDPDLLLALKVFLATNNASEDCYAKVRDAVCGRFPECEFLSQDRLKRRITQLTGITSIVHDMCINSCIGYTGPFKDLTHCPYCNTFRYDRTLYDTSNGEKKVPCQTFHTIPLGPQLQALYRSQETAAAMCYRRTRTREVVEELQAKNGVLDAYDDFVTGSEYLEAFIQGDIGDHDIALVLSLDGAQLYEKKCSDCWILIWILFELSPDKRYTKRHVLPGGFITGPNKPKHFDSFSYPTLNHLSALQRDGFYIWDAYDASIYLSRPFFVIGTADGPGATTVNGLTGHQGYYSCRLYCPIKGRRFPGDKRYYPVHLKPHHYHVDGCDHADYNFTRMPSRPPDEYLNNLTYLIASLTNREYEDRRKLTGIVKPSLFSGLPSRRMLAIPGCFAADLMHLIALNITDLLLSLWRGIIKCKAPDDKTTWDWAVLQGEAWQEHGKRVAEMTPYLPGSFDVPPRNPAERISSGYKAWEFLTYIFVLGPGLFYGLLPDHYFQNFCKLVAAVRILHQRVITRADITNAHTLITEFVQEFEELYYQRKPERIHFCRPSIHGLLHLTRETIRLGPPCYYTQWTMERTIGNLTEEIKQPSRPYANLAQRGIRRAQVNALKAMIPELQPDETLPRGSLVLGDGYILLRARDKRAVRIPDPAGTAIREYMELANERPAPDWIPHVRRWARLRLPTGQNARSSWKEKSKSLGQVVRMSRNIKVIVKTTYTCYSHCQLVSNR